MSSIHVLGIDRGEESRSMFSDDSRTPKEIAEELYYQGWKYAAIIRDHVLVGGVSFNYKKMTRTWWGYE